MVDPNIKKKADDIRNKVYGKEVRESLASGLEEMSSDVVENEGRQSVVEGRQDSVESQWQAVSDEMTDKDVISAPEIIAARNGEANLKTRIDKDHQEVTAQLAQKASLKEMKERVPKREYQEFNRPRFVVIDDDCKVEAYTVLKPMLDERGMKATFSTVTSRIGRTDLGIMTLDQMKSLASQGHEFINHTHTHPNLTNMSESELISEFETSKAIMDEHGWNSDVLVYPFSNNNAETVKIVKRYFEAALISNWRNTMPLETYNLKRIGLGAHGFSDFEAVRSRIATSVENNELIILVTHVGDNTPEENLLLERVFDYVLNLGYNFETFGSAYEHYRNLLDVGQHDEESGLSHLVIGRDGTVAGRGFDKMITKMSDKLAEEIDNNSHVSEFENGKITYTKILSTNRIGFPEDSSGLLMTNKLVEPYDSSMWKQEFIPTGNARIYRRTWIPFRDEWGAWRSNHVTHPNPINFGTTYENITPGVFMNRFNNSQADDSPTPGTGGVLTTFNEGSGFSYCYQEWHPIGKNYHYKRKPTSDTSWRPWNIVGLPVEQTQNRPTNPVIGSMTYDTTLRTPIWYDGYSWKNAIGETV